MESATHTNRANPLAGMEFGALRVGILMPEFPGQTHAFFWREIQGLRELGVHVVLFSTRKPVRNEIVHDFSEQAMAQTEYLYPPSLGHAMRTLAGLDLDTALRVPGTVGYVLRLPGLRPQRRLKALTYVAFALHLARRAAYHGIHHLHVHSCGDSALLALLAHRLSGLPYSLRLHSDISAFGECMREKCAEAEYIVAVAAQLKDKARKLLPSSRRDRLGVVPMGVDTHRFAPARYHGRTNADGRLVTVARLHPGKGHKYVLQAMAILRNRAVPVTYEVVGAGPAESSLRALASDLGVSHEVTFHGPLRETGVLELLQAADVFVLPSLDEAIGVSLMEAMAVGLPVVATRIGGIPELVQHGVHGLLVPARSPEALADAIDTLLRNPEIRARMGTAGRETVRNDFDTPALAARLLSTICPTASRSTS